MRYVYHTFRPTETIDAVLRLLGRHNLTKAELLPLREAFNELNEKIVPKPGMLFKIPLPFEADDGFGNIIHINQKATDSFESVAKEESIKELLIQNIPNQLDL